MAEHDAHETFGAGLRAHLARLGAEDADAGATAADRAVPPPPDELAQRARHLAEREQRFAERVPVVEAHTRELARREQELRERALALEEQARTRAESRPVREALREHAELSLGRIVQVFDDALAATESNGAPDFGVRLAAVRALLAEAYAGDPQSAAATAGVVDELAAMRDRRAGDSSA